MNSFLDRLQALITAAAPSGYRVREQAGDWSPTPGLITYAASITGASPGSNPRLGFASVDIDVWARGPDSGLANTAADAVLSGLEGISVGPEEGDLHVPRLTLRSRSLVDGDNSKLAHITMTLSGRAYRRH